MRITSILKNRNGFTLVETLATLAIISFIAIMLFSIIISSQKQYKMQSEKNKQMNDITYALKLITKDIRKYPNGIKINNGPISISVDLDQSKTIEYRYNDATKTIEKDGIPIVSNIGYFYVDADNNNLPNWITLEIKSGEKSVSTKLILRKGNSSQ